MSFESNNFEPNIILCVFPNLEKILFLSSGSHDKNLFTIQSKFIFDEEFFDSIESKFSKTLRSGNLSLLGPNGVPEKIENILRDETIETIIDSVNQKLELNSEVNQENISIFFFSGQVLNFDYDELEKQVVTLATEFNEKMELIKQQSAENQIFEPTSDSEPRRKSRRRKRGTELTLDD